MWFENSCKAIVLLKLRSTEIQKNHQFFCFLQLVELRWLVAICTLSLLIKQNICTNTRRRMQEKISIRFLKNVKRKMLINSILYVSLYILTYFVCMSHEKLWKNYYICRSVHFFITLFLIFQGEGGWAPNLGALVSALISTYVLINKYYTFKCINKLYTILYLYVRLRFYNIHYVCYVYCKQCIRFILLALNA
jgi:K+-sensing histidine kinase KdpD